jgi:hypothetical protein
MSKPRLPTPEEAKHPHSVKPEDLSVTTTAGGAEITYDVSKPVFLATRQREGSVKIPLYEDVPKVTGRFKNIEHPGQPICIPFRKGWKGPIRYFSLEENKSLTIPVTLCDTLNNGCAYIEKKWVNPDGSSTNRPVLDMRGGVMAGNLQKEVKNRRSRFQFIVDHKVSWKPTIEAKAV